MIELSSSNQQRTQNFGRKNDHPGRLGFREGERIMKTRIGTYEALFLFPVSATVDPEAAVKRVEEIVTKHQGEIIHLRKWDERRLAYEVKKNKRGLYVLCFYKGPGASVGQVTRDVNLSEDILRVLITDASHLTVEEMKAQEPQQPAPREERPRRDDFMVPAGMNA